MDKYEMTMVNESFRLILLKFMKNTDLNHIQEGLNYNIVYVELFNKTKYVFI